MFLFGNDILQRLPSRVYFRAEDAEKEASWWRGIVRDVSWSPFMKGESYSCQFRALPSDHPLPANARSGVQFDTISVNPEVYLPWLKSELEGRGVGFVRRRVHSLDEACKLAGENGAVINATSLGELYNRSNITCASYPSQVLAPFLVWRIRSCILCGVKLYWRTLQTSTNL